MGLFISFEGPDGSGKSTQIKLITEHLQQLGYDVLETREPGGTAIGDQIRQVLHNVANTEMDARAEVLLYSASRAQLVAQVILPQLDRGGVVVCDRFADSTFAYQGYGRRLDFDVVNTITQFATQSLKPDITIYLDVDAAEGLNRKKAASTAGLGKLNRMDRLELDFHQRVRAGYLEMARAEPGRWMVVDAHDPVQEVQQQIRTRLALILAEVPSGK
jgi:dTMP kinase